MDLAMVSEYISQKEVHFMQFNCDTLSKMLDNKEYVEIEDKKDELFFKRIDYIAMALSFKANMEFGSNMKQVITYLK